MHSFPMRLPCPHVRISPLLATTLAWACRQNFCQLTTSRMMEIGNAQAERTHGNG
jgi:hypothetical protein